MSTPMMSYYPTLKHSDLNNMREISIDNYITFIRLGGNYQDLIFRARAEKQKGNIDAYKELKKKAPVVTGSCVFNIGQSKDDSNIVDSNMNGLILMDMDNDQVTPEILELLKSDEFSYIVHSSFGGGDNYVVFVKIDPTRFYDSFENLAQYYLDKYGIKVDPSCKNRNRLRFMSYDPDLYYNERSKRWKATKPKQKEIKKHDVEYLFLQDDFDNIISQIKERGIDLCQDYYQRWVNIGMSLATHFGIGGSNYFDTICSMGSKFDPKTNSKDYQGFCDTISQGTARSGAYIGIGTFYHYCKEAGIDIYSEKTKNLINVVKVSKSTGTPTVQTVMDSMDKKGFNIGGDDITAIETLISSKQDFSKLANSELKEIEVLENFIIDRFNPYFNEIDHEVYIDEGVRLDNHYNNLVYLECKKALELKKDLTKDNISSILENPTLPIVNPVKDFFEEHFNPEFERGIIDAYADCLQSNNPQFTRWALTRWLVGTVHNWIREDYNDVSPLTFGLCGPIHGGGKTSYVRDMLPFPLSKYFDEEKIDSSKPDSKKKMGTNLIILDDEFGGKTFKDVEDFKAIADSVRMRIRLPYARRDVEIIRRVSFAFTTNKMEILNDPTGKQRRILPISVERIDFDSAKKIDKVKLLCEAYGLLTEGFDWKIYKEEDVKYLYDCTLHNQVIMPFDEIFSDHFKMESGGGFGTEVIINKGDIQMYFKTALSLDVKYFEINTVVMKNGLQYSSHRIRGGTKKGYRVYVKPGQPHIQPDWIKAETKDDDVPF